MVLLKLAVILFFCWLLFISVKLMFKLTWGAAKLIGIVLCIIACPVLVLCLVFAGGIVLFSPLLLLIAVCALLASAAES